MFSFFLNLFYALSNGIYALHQHSPWLGTLSAYYIFLSVMRWGIAWYGWKLRNKEAEEGQEIRELTIYKHTGALLLMMTVVLGGAGILLVHNEGGKSYSGTLVLAVAAYTFYKVILSAIHMVKARKTQSLLLVAVRNIGYADALVSVLYLQTAMFAAYGAGENTFQQRMNAITGAIVCITLFLLGGFMIHSSRKRKKKLQDNLNQKSLKK